MKHLILACALTSLFSCVTNPLRAPVRQEDLESWRGVSVTELETHPLFSAMQLDKRSLTDGTVLYNFRNAGGVSQRESCQRMFGTVQCNGQSQELSCMNQFFVKGNAVVEYRPVGSCFTDCSTRPNSKPCADREPAEQHKALFDEVGM